jgi:SAM-dependent methyltransferase
MSWGGGYVIDIDYIAGAYASQSQALMALAALLNGVSARLVRRDEAFHYCDIGCGLGGTALISAAANPGWQVTGLDFNPGHIAAARDLARQAGLENVTFLEVDLKDFAQTSEARGLADFDAVTAHGVWSWVDADVQTGILRLLNTKLKPGGMFHVSYNQLTGWQGGLGLQRLIREAGLRLAGRSDRQAAAGIKVARDLADAGPVSYAGGTAGSLLNRFKDLPGNYAAHELMNAHWRPLMHADVAARMREAKLDFAGSTKLIQNFPQLTLAPAQRAIAERFDDPGMLELLKDICLPTALRNDVYVRGPRRIDATARDAALRDVVLALTLREEAWRFEFEAAGGMAQMSEAYYRPVLRRLQAGPASVGELLQLPDLEGRRDNPAELLGVLIGTEQAAALANPGAAMDARCARLNTVLLRAQFAAGQGREPLHFAVPATGHGMTLPNFEGMILHELDANPEDRAPRDMAARLAIHQTAEKRAELAEKLKGFFTIDAPMLRHFGFAA